MKDIDCFKQLGAVVVCCAIIGIKPVLGNPGGSDALTNRDAISKAPLVAEPFPAADVRLLSGPFKEAFERNRIYLLQLDPERLLHNFRVNARIPSHVLPLGGWEGPDCELRGHFTGHYLSASALMYAASGDPKIKEHADRLVAGLAECQKALGGKYLSAFPEELFTRSETAKQVWAPWYTLHKIYAGLLDMYLLCGNQQALAVLNSAVAWAKSRTDRLDEARMQEMLKVEFGGMGEVLASLYSVTGNPDHLALARRFDKRSFTQPLAEGRDALKGLHANTHIPQAIAAARLYEVTGDRHYREIASYFWHQVTTHRGYCTGGTSNYEYWRQDPGNFVDELSAETHENCCTYNMLRLSRRLFSWTADPVVADYYERALLNGILPTQNPGDGGGLMYYVPLKSGLFKMFGVPESSYYCCNGSGIESFSTLASSIYFHDSAGIFVNLFVPSEVLWRARGITLLQETRFPEDSTARFSLVLGLPQRFSLHLRIPSWVEGTARVKINGIALQERTVRGNYAVINRVWADGDNVELTLPMGLHLWPMPDDSSVAAIMYGPVVLAGELGTEGMTPQMQDGSGFPEVERMVGQGSALPAPVLVAPPSHLEGWIVPVKDKSLTFRTVNSGKPDDVTLIPFYRMFHQRYAVYWDFYREEKWEETIVSKINVANELVDEVVIGDPGSERKHNFQAYRFLTGQTDGMNWVKSSLWFRYDLKVDPGRENTILCTFAMNEKPCTFEVLVDGLLLTTQSLGAEHPGKHQETSYRLPAEFLGSKKRVAVMFKTKEGGMTGELYRLAIHSGIRR